MLTLQYGPGWQAGPGELSGELLSGELWGAVELLVQPVQLGCRIKGKKPVICRKHLLRELGLKALRKDMKACAKQKCLCRKVVSKHRAHYGLVRHFQWLIKLREQHSAKF